MQLRKVCNHPYLFDEQSSWCDVPVSNVRIASPPRVACRAFLLTLIYTHLFIFYCLLVGCCLFVFLRTFQEIIRSSGKFDLLDRLLPKLNASGHRVLLFTQMTRVLDVLEPYLEWRGWQYLRLDGSTKQEDRAQLIVRFLRGCCEIGA